LILNQKNLGESLYLLGKSGQTVMIFTQQLPNPPDMHNPNYQVRQVATKEMQQLTQRACMLIVFVS
jgi:hypothetical protein